MLMPMTLVALGIGFHVGAEHANLRQLECVGVMVWVFHFLRVHVLYDGLGGIEAVSGYFTALGF
jgi:hypothetical protein